MQPMPRVPPLDRPATYEDLVKLPTTSSPRLSTANCTRRRGRLCGTPVPNCPSVARLRVRTTTGSAVRAAGGFCPSPNCTSAGACSCRTWRAGGERACRRCPTPCTATLAPDWVCEVLSPSTASFDRVRKLAVYAREAVAHAWLIDPIAQTLEVFRLESGLWVLAATHAGDDVVRVEPFGEVDLELALLWSEPPSLA